jgi:uncharacterized protein YndB with AHSA1/START domain
MSSNDTRESTSGRTATITTPSATQILITREFEAPKAAVYAIWTTPDHVRRWWAGGQGETTLVELDLSVGGRWRYVLESQGTEVGFHGEYREIVPNERLVWTEHYEGGPEGEPVINTLTLTEHDGRTTLELRSDFADEQTRDLVLGSGMEVGVQGQMDTIDELARTL